MTEPGHEVVGHGYVGIGDSLENLQKDKGAISGWKQNRERNPKFLAKWTAACFKNTFAKWSIMLQLASILLELIKFQLSSGFNGVCQIAEFFVFRRPPVWRGSTWHNVGLSPKRTCSVKHWFANWMSEKGGRRNERKELLMINHMAFQSTSRFWLGGNQKRKFCHFLFNRNKRIVKNKTKNIVRENLTITTHTAIFHTLNY